MVVAVAGPVWGLAVCLIVPTEANVPLAVSPFKYNVNEWSHGITPESICAATPVAAIVLENAGMPVEPELLMYKLSDESI